MGVLSVYPLSNMAPFLIMTVLDSLLALDHPKVFAELLCLRILCGQNPKHLFGGILALSVARLASF